MKLSKILSISIILIYVTTLHSLQADEEQAMNKHAEMVSKCDIGYKVTFPDKSKIPSHIEILLHTKNDEKALDSFAKSTLENLDEKLAGITRVDFIWRNPNDKESQYWTFAEKDGKIRIHDLDEMKGYWIDLKAFLKLVAEKRNGDLKVVE